MGTQVPAYDTCQRLYLEVSCGRCKDRYVSVGDTKRKLEHASMADTVLFCHHNILVSVTNNGHCADKAAQVKHTCKRCQASIRNEAEFADEVSIVGGTGHIHGQST